MKIKLEKENIKIELETTETLEGITWFEIAELFTIALKGLGYFPEALETFLEGEEE